MQLASVPQAEKTERLQWVHDMRSAFSPPAMLTDDGDIRQEFFKPKKVFAPGICMSAFIGVSFQPLQGAHLSVLSNLFKLLTGLTCDVFIQVVLVDDKKWSNVERDLLYEVYKDPSQLTSNFN